VEAQMRRGFSSAPSNLSPDFDQLYFTQQVRFGAQETAISAIISSQSCFGGNLQSIFPSTPLPGFQIGYSSAAGLNFDQPASQFGATPKHPAIVAFNSFWDRQC